MARKRVVAYFIHQADRDEVASRLTSAEMTDSFAVGDIGEEDIAELRNQGIVVQIQPSPPAEEPASGAMSLGIRSAQSAERFPDAMPAETDYYLIKLNGPLI